MKDNDYISCRELIEILADYIDGTLTSQVRHEFERHLSVCPSCIAYLDGYNMTIALGRAAFGPTDEPALSRVPDSLLRSIREARARRS